MFRAVAAFFAAMFTTSRGMGTIDRPAVKVVDPYRHFQGYAIRGTRNTGLAPEPRFSRNQRQRRKLKRQTA